MLALLVLTPLGASAKAFKLLQTGSEAMSTNLLQNILAKEICSCVYVSQVGGPNSPLNERVSKCLMRSQLPLSPQLLSLLVREKIDPNTRQFEVTDKVTGALLSLFQGHHAVAKYFGPGEGCRLLLPNEVPK